jgi:hypothetical protein
MLTTALLLMLASSDVKPAFLTGNLHGAPSRIRLVEDDTAAMPDYSGWSRLQLRQEYNRLDEARPGLGMPIALMASGGGVLLVGLYGLLVSALAVGLGVGAVSAEIIFAVLSIVGAGLLILGGITLARTLPERRWIGLQLDEIDQRLKTAEENRTPGRVPGSDPVGPPPPPFPGPAAMPPSQVMAPQFPITLARF